MYHRILIRMTYRIRKPANLSGMSWFKHGKFEIGIGLVGSEGISFHYPTRPNYKKRWPPRLPNLAFPCLLSSEILLFPPYYYNTDMDMELKASPSSHQFNVRKTGEPGLAEWAQKIRALQRQVDEDEEEEHRKLEQEIAASRLARVRRSHGAENGRSSLDPVAGMPSLRRSWVNMRIDSVDVRTQCP